MSFKYQCSDCGRVFYPKWWSRSGQSEPVQCIECSSKSVTRHVMSYQEVAAKAARLNGCGSP